MQVFDLEVIESFRLCINSIANVSHHAKIFLIFSMNAALLVVLFSIEVLLSIKLMWF